MSNNLLSRLRSMAGAPQGSTEAVSAPDTGRPSISVGPSSITFTVDDVTPADARLNTCPPLDAVRALLDAPLGPYKDEGASQGYPTRGRAEAAWSSTLECLDGIAHHPVIAATHLAFSQHRPLVFSPDVIWVTIVQGLAQHLRLAPDAYRAGLVRHDGKRPLVVRRAAVDPGVAALPWDAVIADLASQVRQEIGDRAEQFLCDFSTTGPTERTVSEVALLDALQPYFSYHVVCICGIPSVTLDGTAADWQKLREKVELLAPFGLDWWLPELRRICDQFARAAAGDVDLRHWRRLYKLRAVYGAEVINGWLGKLFPYVKDFETGLYSRRNLLLDPNVDAEIRRLEAEEERSGKPAPMFSAPGVTADSLPRGVSQVPFTLHDERGAPTAARAMEFLAGAVAVTQDVDTGALRPTLGWAVREAPPIEQALLRLAEHPIKRARSGLSQRAFSRRDLNYVPSDVLRFYQEVESAVIHGSDGLPLYRVFSFKEWTEPEQPTGRTKAERLFRFAVCGDGTEVLIHLQSGAVRVGRGRDGLPVRETGRQIARSFTDFLLRALNGGGKPYFRREGGV